MINYQALPAINATLNGLATLLLLWGYTMIRQRRIQAHLRIMISAFIVSVIFLVCYLTYHAHVLSVKYTDKHAQLGTLGIIYYVILFTHVVLAFAVPPLAVMTLWRAYKGNFSRHRKIAVWTFPIWLYVSVTGVIVYLLLYQF